MDIDLDFTIEGLRLGPHEEYWRDLYPFLKSNGYELRPRFRPGWEPTWSSDELPGGTEDSIGLPLFRSRMIDAIRVADGKMVYFKVVKADSQELEITRYLSSEPLRRDPRNHCVELLDVLPHPDDPNLCFMVLPCLRDIDSPPFESVDELMECGEQLLEGLVFMHEHDVAHRDCALRNLMMDASAMYPRGFHPIYRYHLLDAKTLAPVLSRSSAGVKYYFVDFGISTHFRPEDTSRLVLGTDGIETTVPELSKTVPYDPFKVDIYILGAMFRQAMLQKYTNLTMISPLVASMMHKDPKARPSAAEALDEWRRQRSTPHIVPDSFARLTDEEIYWKDRQRFLEARGYLLRPRYRPDWVPSWQGTSDVSVLDAEDAYSLPYWTNVMDATRVSDGSLVYLKRARTNSQELRIVSHMNSSELREDPRNRCVPLLDVLQDPFDDNVSLMVMPFLRYIDSPEMERVEDVLDCVDQILEVGGTTIVPEVRIAHRDCAFKNVMMDASDLFPKGFHPVLQMSLPDISGKAPTRSRADVPIKYYYIDFGISTQFPAGAPRLVTGTLGLDREPPELSDAVPYDPFKLDVFLIGNLIRRELCDKYSNLTMLEPLVSRMVRHNPAERPSAAEAHRQFTALRRSVSTPSLYWILQPRDSALLLRAFRAVYSFVRSALRPSRSATHASGEADGHYLSLCILVHRVVLVPRCLDA
ncbi:hypothetical protein C8Q77DRAFT_1047583 [Trametes polyzona]|nr:hypothetical protein C8Q77DRAFT_1047583 [Trametes polyzona]